MEAIGAISSIIAVAGAGAKLSIILFEFASTVASAGQEVRQIGIEISLFCSVLKQLQSTLTKAKAYRYSFSAIETTQEILNRCREVFEEIEEIVNGLRKRGLKPLIDSVARVKWTFKRSKVQVLRTTLESCKVTLHLMLSTLEFAQKIATRRTSTIENQAEDDHERIMTRSLVIAHQCTIDTLQRLEEEEVEQLPVEGGMPSPPSTPLEISSTEQTARFLTSHNPSQSFNSRNSHFLSSPRNLARKRASVWINGLTFDKSSLPQEFRRQTMSSTESALFLKQQPNYFLQKWTDQGENIIEIPKLQVDHQAIRQNAQSDLVGIKTMESKHLVNPHRPGFFPDPAIKTQNTQLLPNLRNDSNAASSPQILRQEKFIDPNSSIILSIEILEHLQVRPDDPCYKVLPAVLKKYSIQTPWHQYALHIAHGKEMRCLGSYEKPLIALKMLDERGKNPRVVLQDPRTRPTRKPTITTITSREYESEIAIKVSFDATALPYGELIWDPVLRCYKAWINSDDYYQVENTGWLSLSEMATCDVGKLRDISKLHG